ncbi:MAG: hypothetical protein RRY79_01670 [Clostridia bacterium]
MNFIKRLNEFKKMRVLMILGFVITLFVGFLIGAIVFDRQDGDALNVSKAGELSVLPTTNVEWEFKFICGHIEKQTGRRDITGLTKSEILKLYENADITFMDKDNVKISVYSEEYCEQHYLLVLMEGDMLAVMHTNIDTLRSEQLAVIPINTEGIDEGTLTELAAGKLFDSLSEIDAFIEGIDS